MNSASALMNNDWIENNIYISAQQDCSPTNYIDLFAVGDMLTLTTPLFDIQIIDELSECLGCI